MSAAIGGVVVGIPARGEDGWIGRSLSSVRAACDRLPAGMQVRVVVAADSCRDRTVEVARGAAAGDRRIAVIEGEWRSAGTARRHAIDHGLRQLRRTGIEAGAVWIATTDADTEVPADWLVVQLDLQRAGADAVAGIVELCVDADRTEAVASLFQRTYAVGTHTHEHVHAANMGVRADAYGAVGGFTVAGPGEDHALWAALRAAGFRCTSSVALRVATSARLRGRAPGGFAAALRSHLGRSHLDRSPVDRSHLGRSGLDPSGSSHPPVAVLPLTVASTPGPVCGSAADPGVAQ